MGEWTLCGHFMQMFSHLIFPHNAIRINAIEYNNTINIDNIKGQKTIAVTEGGQAIVKESRHPYEFPQNEAYFAFLSQGLHYPFQPWGKDVGPLDVSDVQVGVLPYQRSAVISSLMEGYDIRYPGIASSDYIKAIPKIEKMQYIRAMAQKLLCFRIIVFTFNRPASLERLWKSIEEALPLKHTKVLLNYTSVLISHLLLDNR